MAQGEHWRLIDSGEGTPAFNMAFDERLLEAPPEAGQPILRLYGWSLPAATFGYSQRYADAARLTALRPLVRRPTGGGVVPHDGDWTYTLCFPPGHWWYALRARQSYEQLHVWLQTAFHRMGLATQLAPTAAAGAPTHCFVRAEQFDVLWRGAKIAGAAQRRTRQGLLIQGSVQPPPGAQRELWIAALLEQATLAWGVTWSRFEPHAAWLGGVQALAATTFSQDAFNRRR
jgi:lipoate-protein ligase A